MLGKTSNLHGRALIQASARPTLHSAVFSTHGDLLTLRQCCFPIFETNVAGTLDWVMMNSSV